MAEPEFTTEELQNEEWRVIEDFPDYEVSSIGRVRRATDGIHTFKGRILGRRLKKGYWTVCLSKPDPIQRKQFTRNIHRLLAIAFLGKPPLLDSQVNHKNGIKMDNRLGNLEWCTPLENNIHAAEVLQVNCGEKAPNAKLSADNVLTIYAELLNGTSPRILAKQYNIPTGHVYQIKRKRTWRHLLKDLPTNFQPVQWERTLKLGEDNPVSKLTTEQATEIKKLALAGVNYGIIARQFNISRAAICLIKQGRTWKHI